VLGEPDGRWRLDFTEQVVGNRSPVQSELMDTISAWVGERDPGSRVVPVVLPGSPTRAIPPRLPGLRRLRLLPHRHQSMLESAPLVHARTSG